METPAQKVTRLLNQACARYPGGLRAVYRAIVAEDGSNRSESTFYADFNPNPSSLGKLKTRDLIAAMKVTADVEPLRYLASLFGYALTSLRSVEPDAPTLDAEMLSDFPSVVEFHKAIKAGEDDFAILAKLDAAIADLRQTYVMAKKEKSDG